MNTRLRTVRDGGGATPARRSLGVGVRRGRPQTPPPGSKGTGRGRRPGGAVLSAGDETGVVSVSPPKRRRPSWVAAGVVLVVLAALLGAYVFSTMSDTVKVMVADHDLAAGVPVAATDLRVVEMGRTGGLRAVQPADQRLIVGLAPRGMVPAGTVLNTGLFVPSGQLLPAGKVVVGATFEAGAVPTASLGPQDRVTMLAVIDSAKTPTAEGAVAPAAMVLGEATVWAVTGSAADGGPADQVWVSLLVDESLQTAVAQTAADGHLRLSLAAML